MKKKTTLPVHGGLREGVNPYDIVHRYEKIPTKVYPTEPEAVHAIADRVVAAIKNFVQSPIDDYTYYPRSSYLLQSHPPLPLARRDRGRGRF